MWFSCELVALSPVVGAPHLGFTLISNQYILEYTMQDMVSNYTNFCWFIKGTNILKLQKYRKYTVQELHGTTWDSLGRRADKAWAVTTRSNKSLEAKRDCLLVTRDGLSKTQIAWESTSSGIARLNSFNRTHSLVWCMSVTLSQGGCKVWWGWWWSGSYGRQTFPAPPQLVGLDIQVELTATRLW